jgi:hypothetical protein
MKPKRLSVPVPPWAVIKAVHKLNIPLAINLSQISQMEIELPSMPLSIRTPYQTRLASSKSDLNKVKKALVSSTFTLSSPSPLNKGSPFKTSCLLECGLNHSMSR